MAVSLLSRWSRHSGPSSFEAELEKLESADWWVDLQRFVCTVEDCGDMQFRKVSVQPRGRRRGPFQ